MQSLLLFVDYDDVRLEVGQAEVHWDGSPASGFPTWQITEDFKLRVHTVHNVVYEVVVSPCVS